MNISSVNGSGASYASQSVQRTPEAAETKRAGPDNDGDADDGAQAAAPKPTVNVNGQALGKLINVAA